MLKDIKSYVDFDITEYIRQIKPIIPMEKSFAFQQTLEHLLPSVFVKMTGCLEHKLDMVSLHLSMDDEQWRQDMMRLHSNIPSSSKGVEKVVNAIVYYITDNFNSDYSCEIWADKDRFGQSSQMICTILDEINVADYLGAYYIMLKNGASKLPETLTVKSNKGNPKEEDFAKVIYDQAIRFRNIYAHNEESVYIEFYKPQKLNSEIARYNNWCFRFTVVTYMDILIRNLFRDYVTFREKTLLM